MPLRAGEKKKDARATWSTLRTLYHNLGIRKKLNTSVRDCLGTLKE
jgi:hypothetical protein